MEKTLRDFIDFFGFIEGNAFLMGNFDKEISIRGQQMLLETIPNTQGMLKGIPLQVDYETNHNGINHLIEKLSDRVIENVEFNAGIMLITLQ